jgi:cephalosporin hydroxylase
MSITSYYDVISNREFDIARTAPDRFKSILDREDRCDFPTSIWNPLAVSNAYKSSWKNLLLNKGPIELALYPLLIDELRPLTIIELGALHGGSAVWLADITRGLSESPRIISIEIDIKLVDENALNDSRIEFIEGDAWMIEEILPSHFLDGCPHPWLIIEDCHVNTSGILDHFYNAGLSVGDYLIIEDTNQDAWDAWLLHWMDESRVSRGKQKLPNLRKWLSLHLNMRVDTFYQDFYGYNVGKNWNSILRYC